MEGIPAHLHPIIRANSTEVCNIEDFRRVLIDLEPGIRDVRGFAPHAAHTIATSHTSQVNTVVTPVTKSRDDELSFDSRKEKKGLPKTSYRCGGMHWYSDCPQKTKKGKPGKDISANNRSDATTDTSGQKEAKISPTFALARFDAEEGMQHPICIDIGSSISCIDSEYARRYLPNGKIVPTSNLRLMGVGTNITSGTITTTLSFATTDPNKSYKAKVTLYVVPRLNTEILLGNDHLVPLNSVVDFENNSMTFGNDKLRVMITNKRVLLEYHSRRTARTRQVFTLQPGHQGKIPVILFPQMDSGMYCIEAVNGSNRQRDATNRCQPQTGQLDGAAHLYRARRLARRE
ncbi:hypothetical protein QFC20_007766 [Naganishia adeliensis]|uniref:Uncharacterized protein n=1 Tax=Naganishia adeliensis TaxID=92952 RepID=A0ACC2UVW5_9TREE|nr:hypothetical protein QFC20_007766 [Naganishia adeliensis]